MNSLPNILHTISYMALPLLLAMVFHEYAHGWVANHYGDATARLEGRLTMNPLAHVDPFGTVILPLLCLMLPGGFFLGWAKPVPINPSRLRNPRRDMALVAAAGPGMNLLLAVASAVILSALLSIDPTLMASWPPQPGQPPRRDLLGMLLLPVAAMALYSVFINVLLMAFNLIPIPPLDGGRILTSLLPAQPALALSRLEPYGMLIIVALIMFDPQIHVIRTITGTLVHAMAGTILSTVLE
ncbi:MAG TPA: site-2 protease family protein [Nitrospiraceae bacterium]|nr:site-2 protease family protein [Nitrospiraceae bacterium]